LSLNGTIRATRCQNYAHRTKNRPISIFLLRRDRDEPSHIHVERDANTAKFWLDPVRLQSSGGFSRTEINRIQELVEENREVLLERCNEFFNG
jgi:uncharacterized protein DUF4160